MKAENSYEQGKTPEDPVRMDRYQMHFLWFVFGNLAGYLWAVKAFGLF